MTITPGRRLMRDWLKSYFPSGRGAFHRRFAELIAELDGRTGFAADQLRLAAALVSYRLEQGEVCLPLAEVAGRSVAFGSAEAEAPTAEVPRMEAPAREDWLASLRGSPVVSGPDGEARPLVLLEDGRLYLRRYWNYQQRRLAALRARAEATGAAPEAVRAQLDRFFEPPGEEIDWQRLAAALALQRRLSIITGGAGTVNTTTVVQILTALRQLDGPAVRIALAAPTGKSSARLSEAIRSAKARMTLPAEVLD